MMPRGTGVVETPVTGRCAAGPAQRAIFGQGALR